MSSENLMLKIGDMCGPYHIIRLLGRGGMGEVYEAFEASLQRKVALKIMSERGLESPEMVERFMAEARALAKVSHPNVVSIYAFGKIGRIHYMAMEYVDGVSLDQFIRKMPYGFEDSIKIFRQMLAGLAAAHAQEIIHRDLKPLNIIIERKGGVKVIDFGIAKQMNDPNSLKTSTGVFMGTINYLAPETARGQVASYQTDVYGLGVILYEMVTGRVPFIGKSNIEILDQIRFKQLEFPQKIEILLPSNIKSLIFKMTAKSLMDRYLNVHQIETDLQKIDLSELPAELKAARVQSVKIKNLEAIQELLKQKKFEDLEIKMILNLACEIETELHSDPSQTLVSDGTDSVIEISESALSEAQTRYTFARNDLSVRRTTKIAQRTQQTVTSQFQPKKGLLSWSNFGALVVLLIGAAVVNKAVRSRAAVEPAGRSIAGAPEIKKDFAIEAKDLDLIAVLPSYKVGDTFVFLENAITSGPNKPKTKKVTWTVNQIVGSDIQWASDAGGTRLMKANLFYGPFRVTNEGGDGDYIETKTGDFNQPFPLVTGKKIEFEIYGKSIDERRSWMFKRSCEVREKVLKDYQDKKVWTYEVYCKQDGSPSDPDPLEIWHYYSPELRYDVAIRYRSESKNNTFRDRTTILLDVKPGN